MQTTGVKNSIAGIGVDHVKDEIERLHDKRYDAFVLDQCLQGLVAKRIITVEAAREKKRGNPRYYVLTPTAR